MPIAYSYSRFSSTAQEGNDSLRRQAANAKAFIDSHPEHELVLDTSLKMTDEGVSAYKGDNMKFGALGKFTDAVRNGLIPEGSWLLLESLDRFTRQSVNLAAAELLGLINRGIVVATIHNETIYRASDFQDNQYGLVNLLGALIAMNGHHAEQVTKGRRVAAAWSAKYSKIAQGHKLSSIVPFWLTLNADRMGFTVDEAKAEVVRIIYRKKAAGEGKYLISKWLNEQRIPTPKSMGIWQLSTVDKLLMADTVVGVLESKNGRYDDYYPKLFEPHDATYQAVRALRKTVGKTSTAYHPLTGLVKHSCGATLRRRNKGVGQIKLFCPKCLIAAKYSEALSACEEALRSTEWEASTTAQGQETKSIEADLWGLDEEIEVAFGEWRRTKGLTEKSTYERLLTEASSLRASLQALKGSNTEVLALIEEQALLRADRAKTGLLGALRQVVASIETNHEISKVFVTTISGKKCVGHVGTLQQKTVDI